ncbi:GTP 3',8-cyclase MoaA [Candidatus Schmidhempelia bombi]|uniref:GTP 3',8-cyclase n=1 Tax=Candidatus Schmidhempelia bombi str. Bimp TaxID=1387197 RepID=A0AB94ICG5_9GAMM|nr:GTP 3',8-cyclase MoaA [Candidatus Schmidhempelia bombi]TEA27108.1 GTP 3',8-cyclase MoaA [Candidatus Schmidhempelia bombi str. Bimp]
MQLIDNYQRRFKYLRLSITEVCNFQCQYCLPNGYAIPKDGAQRHFLTLNEIEQIIACFADLGITKIRLTGGEPTLRRDFLDILSLIYADSRIKVRALTTNGFRLLNHVADWQRAGLTAINISVDSLSSDTFKLITGQDRLREILAGIDKALTAGLQTVKVNTVLLKGVNNHLTDYLQWIKYRPIELRFIELMETGMTGDLFNRLHISGQCLEQQLLAEGWQRQAKDEVAGAASVYAHSDYQGKIGLIMPYSKDFCQTCNRLRISATGKIHFCLFGENGIDLRDLLQSPTQRDALKSRILSGLTTKPEHHLLQQHQTGLANTLSYLGG